MESIEAPAQSFTEFVREVEPRLRTALVARFGQDRGREATAEALAYGWEHWSRLRQMENPAGYLYRVGRSRLRHRRRRPVFHSVPADTLPDVEPGLPSALGSLTAKQRTAVVMVHAYGWTRREAADTLGMTVSTLDTHLQRGLARLRDKLGVDT